MNPPKKTGLYDSQFEKDACGIGFVTHIRGVASHSILSQGLQVLDRLSHRGAQGADPLTGDGAGVLLQIPHKLFKTLEPSLGFSIPEKGKYVVGMVFLPPDATLRSELQDIIERVIREEHKVGGATFLGWRTVPVNPSVCGTTASLTEPLIQQIFIALRDDQKIYDRSTDRMLYFIRRRIENQISKLSPDKLKETRKFFSIPSFSHKTIVYKGLLLPENVSKYFTDLTNPNTQTAIALVHSRFSTNTFPTWRLAHPYRMICHNGEINTVKGNINWMRARQSHLKSEAFGPRLIDAFPIIQENQSDSACLDNVLEFLYLGGRSLPHAMMMLIPEPYIANPEMDLERRGFYEYHSSLMEPWDGPAAVCFTDGTLIGATLDRNGLRPCRYQITDDDVVVLASEAGVLPTDINKIVQKGRLQPGKMFLIDTAEGRIISDEEIKNKLAKAKPYRDWLVQDRISLDELPTPLNISQPDHVSLRQRQQLYGYTVEELKMILVPMVVQGEEPTSSMGNDTPLAVLSDRPQLLFKYFRQLFAQVTNPPIDPIREQLVMSLVTSIGPRPNLLSEDPEKTRRIRVPRPILTNADLEKIRSLADLDFRSTTLKMLFNAKSGPDGLREGIIRLCRSATKAVSEGYKFLILSDRDANEEWAPIPSLLAVSAVHHHLVRKSIRTEVALIIESGEPRDVHHFAALIGYGAGSVNPYLALETLVDLTRENYFPTGIDEETAQNKYVSAVNKGLYKIISKMGISTIQSYCGAQIFEALGISSDCIEKYFTGTPSRIGGIGLTEIATETLARHQLAYSPAPIRILDVSGDVHYRVQGERHAWNPDTIAKLQHATQKNDFKKFKEFSAAANEESHRLLSLRGLLEFDFSEPFISIEEVEPASSIVRQFTTGAMSLGAISREAHETLAIAMNRMGGKSNSGEGGEDPERYTPLNNGDSKNSAIKQVASARFGVTIEYLNNAQEIQIKMAQGAKPGEGGQLPGYKVDAYIAKLRHSTPGVGLISPPPHHDIYSIEDLAQLIFDLKNANEAASISVKLVSEVGVGTIAAGVAKAHAEKILISGDSGGTGASVLSSIKYAGLPWELGLAETHQTLVLNGLRGRVRVETDGQMKTGRDVVIAALLGADEFGFATAPLIVEGCIMMRKCHLNTCPVGIATQDPLLRSKFSGQPEHVVNYFFFVAEEIRELMAKLGFRTLAEMVGRVDRLKSKGAIGNFKSRLLDLAPILHRTHSKEPIKKENQNHKLEAVLDRQLIKLVSSVAPTDKLIEGDFKIENRNRATGTMLSGWLCQKKFTLKSAQIQLRFKGSAGQSFGAFLHHAVELRLEGEANDYVGKGLSGGRISIRPPLLAQTIAADTILIGNTVLYGATSGEAFFNGRAGERFAVRNSGADAVVEGTGDHGCEYMTGGRVVVLGPTGRNFAAGMSGGIAYVLNESGKFETRCNLGMIELEKVVKADEKFQLRKLIERHFEFTNSPKAKEVLENWERSLGLFVKVMPIDYKKALLERSRKKP